VESVGIPAVNHVPARAPSPAGADQGFEQTEIPVLFGVPFHTDHERGRRQLNGLDHAVRCPRRRHQTGTETIDRLMVRAPDPDRLVQDLRQSRPGFDTDFRRPEATGRRLVTGVTDVIGEVLDEAASEMDVQHLHAATDGEHRNVVGEGGGEESNLTVIAKWVHAGGGGIGRTSVAVRVHISPTDEDETIEDAHHLRRRRVATTDALTRREKHRAPTDGRHAVHIGRRNKGGGPVPRPPGGILPVCRDSNERRLGLRHPGQYPTVVEEHPTRYCRPVAQRLSDKVALITGAGSGIGRVAAELFASEGAAVVVADVTADAARDTVTAITSAGGRALAVTVDVADEGQVTDMVGATMDAFGALHVLFNNAGIFPGDDGGVLDTPPSTWDRVMQVNLKGVWLGCRAAVPAMIDSGGGSIVNVASFVALMGAATAQVAYTASKGGVLAFTRELAVEYARSGIRANSLCPGPIDTPLLAELLADPVRRQRRLVHVPMGRLGRPEEIARAALFLASDESSFMTGSALVVDGGITAAYVTPE
jgi:NAD(P)-dependent dehydrogenase (short-subunit alcohol dehydrogenase family)